MARRNSPIVAQFVDHYGETRTIHRDRGSRLSVRRGEQTIAFKLAHSVGKLIGARIREERLKAGITGPALAQRAGLRGGKAAMYSIETGLNTGVRLGTVYAIAAALNIQPASLLPSVSEALMDAGLEVRAERALREG